MKAVLVALLPLVFLVYYNFTQAEIEEGRILELCMNLDAYIPNCEIMYGGKGYGDKIQ